MDGVDSCCHIFVDQGPPTLTFSAFPSFTHHVKCHAIAKLRKAALRCESSRHALSDLAADRRWGIALLLSPAQGGEPWCIEKFFKYLYTMIASMNTEILEIIKVV
eukprot:765782-Hanusia_phi.AAC.6